MKSIKFQLQWVYKGISIVIQAVQTTFPVQMEFLIRANFLASSIQ